MDLWERLLDTSTLTRISWRARIIGCLIFAGGIALYAMQDTSNTLAFGQHMLWTFPLVFAVSFALALPRKREAGDDLAKAIVYDPDRDRR